MNRWVDRAIRINQYILYFKINDCCDRRLYIEKLFVFKLWTWCNSWFTLLVVFNQLPSTGGKCFIFTNDTSVRYSGILNLIQSYTELGSIVYWIGFSRILNVAYFNRVDNQMVTVWCCSFNKSQQIVGVVLCLFSTEWIRILVWLLSNKDLVSAGF